MLRTQQIHLMGMLGAIALTVAILSTAIIMTSPSVDSSASDNVSGYAWSETIGWISFNSTNEVGPTASYGVTVETDGAVSGYAWSENIGWISFNASDVSGCPSGTCAPSLDRGNGVNKGVVSGWARALSPTSGVNTGGWDGWISLNCANSGGGACASSNYKVKATDCSWGGFAWGGDVVGWISWSGANGGNVTGTGEGCHPIQYSCVGTPPVDATACSTDDPGVSGIPYGIVGSTVSSCLSGATKCHYYCNSGFAQSGNTCVPTECRDGIDNNDGDIPNPLIDYPADPGCTSANDDDEKGTPPTLTANPRTVNVGGSTVLEWNTGDVLETVCTLQGGNGDYLIPTTDPFTADDGGGDDLYRGTVTISPVVARTMYTINCDGQSASATVDIIPIGVET